jgi:hypothetical protein
MNVIEKNADLDHDNPERQGCNSSHAEAEAQYTPYELLAIRMIDPKVEIYSSQEEECYEYTTEDSVRLVREAARWNSTERIQGRS